MSIIEELQQKLSETRESVEQVVKDLSEYSQIKESLQSADRGISIASSNLDALSDSLKRSTENLNSATLKLGEAVEIVNNTDPTEVLKKQSELESQLQALKAQIDSVTDDTQHTKTVIANLPNKTSMDEKFSQVTRALKESEANHKASNENSSALAERLSRNLSSLSTQTYFVIVIVIIVGLIAFFR